MVIATQPQKLSQINRFFIMARKILEQILSAMAIDLGRACPVWNGLAH
jgi:hypothetical protein